MKKIFLIIFVIFYSLSYSQNKFEFIGVLKLNGNNKSLISYRLVLNLNNKILKGFSITDFGGSFETKNTISGTYNKISNMLTFKEDDILYTKSKYSQDSFCFINFSGKIKLTGEDNKLEGKFNGLYLNKKKCIDGELTLVNAKKAYGNLTKLNKKIKKIKKIDEATKKRIDPINIMDSLKVNNLSKNENLNVFVKSEKVIIEIWDAKIEDGDIIKLYQNNKLLLDNFEVLNKKKRITINLNKEENIFRIEAVSEGDKLLNTAEIKITDGEREFELKSNLKKGESNSITIIKRND